MTDAELKQITDEFDRNYGKKYMATQAPSLTFATLDDGTPVIALPDPHARHVMVTTVTPPCIWPMIRWLLRAWWRALRMGAK